MKNKLTVALMLLLTIAVLVFAAQADGQCGPEMWFYNENGKLTFTGKGEMYIIDPTWCDWNQQPIYEVVFEEGITGITDCAFEGFWNLKRVTLPSTLEKIGYNAFYDCISLESIVIPDKVKTIELNTFKGCKELKTVKLPDRLEEINENAFNGCESLKEITLPATLKTVGKNAFIACNKLDKVYYKGTKSEKEQIVIDPMGNDVITCKGWILDMPENVITLPEDIVQIKLDAFNGSAAECIYIPSAKTELSQSIETDAFAECSNLVALVFEDGEDIYISDDALGDLKDVTVYAPENSDAANWAVRNNFPLITEY